MINIVSNYFRITSNNDTRRDGQPPKSQLAKKSTCQKSQLAKNTNHSILVILHSGGLFGKLTFWSVDFLEVDHFS
jgi:hypothetical protein